jgi:hypothetical protein
MTAASALPADGRWGTASRLVGERTGVANVPPVVFAVIVTVLGLFATARGTRLLARDRISEPARRWVVSRWGPSSSPGYLVHCRWCVSMYLAPIAAAAVIWLVPEYRAGWWLQTALLGALLALSYSHGTALLAGLEDDD